MSTKDNSWNVSLHCQLGHLYFIWENDIFFTETEVRKLHRNLYHPSDSKFAALIERAKPVEAKIETRSAIVKVGMACDTRQCNLREPSRLRVTMPDNTCTFNKVLALDLKSIDGNNVLHYVDRDTKYSAAAFLGNECVQSTWQTFVNIGVTAYVGYSDIIAVDQ